MNLSCSCSLETPNWGQNRWFFVPCDLDIWWMTLKNNRAPLICYFKLALCNILYPLMYSNWIYSPETPNFGQNLLGTMWKQVFDGNQIMFYKQTSPWIQTQNCQHAMIHFMATKRGLRYLHTCRKFPACCSNGSWRRHRPIIFMNSCSWWLVCASYFSWQSNKSSKYRPSEWSLCVHKSYGITIRRYIAFHPRHIRCICTDHPISVHTLL